MANLPAELTTCPAGHTVRVFAVNAARTEAVAICEVAGRELGDAAEHVGYLVTKAEGAAEATYTELGGALGELARFAAQLIRENGQLKMTAHAMNDALNMAKAIAQSGKPAVQPPAEPTPAEPTPAEPTPAEPTPAEPVAEPTDATSTQ